MSTSIGGKAGLSALGPARQRAAAALRDVDAVQPGHPGVPCRRTQLHRAEPPLSRAALAGPRNHCHGDRRGRPPRSARRLLRGPHRQELGGIGGVPPSAALHTDRMSREPHARDAVGHAGTEPSDRRARHVVARLVQRRPPDRLHGFRADADARRAAGRAGIGSTSCGKRQSRGPWRRPRALARSGGREMRVTRLNIRGFSVSAGCSLREGLPCHIEVPQWSSTRPPTEEPPWPSSTSPATS
jgi:hypothetical protein